MTQGGYPERDGAVVVVGLGQAYYEVRIYTDADLMSDESISNLTDAAI